MIHPFIFRLFGIAGGKEQDFSLLAIPTQKIKERMIFYEISGRIKQVRLDRRTG